MASSYKVGVGIITCNRQSYLKLCLESLYRVNNCIKNVDEAILINDGGAITEFDSSFIEQIKNETNLGVGKSKNKALAYLLDKGCDYIFLIEDDLFVKDLNVFKHYIEASKLSGIQHFNFAFHGTGNVDSDGNPLIKLKIDYSKDVSVCLYPNVYGSFSFYTKECLQKVGLMDEEYINAMEHVDHTYSIITAGMHPPFRWFADIANSGDYLQELDVQHKSSEIRRSREWIDNFKKAVIRFYEKSNIDVTNPQHQHIFSKEEAIAAVKEIKSSYGIK